MHHSAMHTRIFSPWHCACMRLYCTDAWYVRDVCGQGMTCGVAWHVVSVLCMQNAPTPTPQPDPHITPGSQSDTPAAADSATGNTDTHTNIPQQRRTKSKGQIAGIVIGSIVGAFAGIALMVMGFLHRERLAEVSSGTRPVSEFGL